MKRYMPILKNLQYFGMWANSIHKQSVRIKQSIFLKFTICFEGGWKWNIFLSLYSIFLLAIFNFPTFNIPIPIPIQSELESTEHTQKMLLFSFKLILILYIFTISFRNIHSSHKYSYSNRNYSYSN